MSAGRGRRWFAESLLIIGSILVAFQVEFLPGARGACHSPSIPELLTS
ncbi:MAG: hypothetical protein V2I57_13595 [Xanthomonadales bacterium]|nr:hypothetical protein [Xanthomonadales bacterium]